MSAKMSAIENAMKNIDSIEPYLRNIVRNILGSKIQICENGHMWWRYIVDSDQEMRLYKSVSTQGSWMPPVFVLLVATKNILEGVIVLFVEEGFDRSGENVEIADIRSSFLTDTGLNIIYKFIEMTENKNFNAVFDPKCSWGEFVTKGMNGELVAPWVSDGKATM